MLYKLTTDNRFHNKLKSPIKFKYVLNCSTIYIFITYLTTTFENSVILTKNVIFFFLLQFSNVVVLKNYEFK